MQKKDGARKKIKEIRLEKITRKTGMKVFKALYRHI